MILEPYLVTALVEDFADSQSTGKNIDVGAVITLSDTAGTPVLMADDAEGSSPSTLKTTTAKGQRIIWVASGIYDLMINGGDAVRIRIGYGLPSYAPPSPLEYGAVGDGVVDDTVALQSWANVGGALFLPRGNYRVTAAINFPRWCRIFGESSGSGTGGTDQTAAELAAGGASVIRPDTVFSGNDVFLFEYTSPDTAYRAFGSLSIRDICFIANQAAGCQANMITVVNAYDALEIANVNLNFVGNGYSALRLIENGGTGFPQLAQTGILSNVVAIGDSQTTATTVPIIYMRRQQEMQLIGVKAFGTAQAVSPRTDKTCIALENCRGITGIGCSVAVTSANAVGLDIYSTDISSDGISFIGTTFEDCEGGGFLIDSSRADPSITVSNVEILASRYQFPQTIAGTIRGSGTSQCSVDTNNSTLTIDVGVSNTRATGFVLNNLTDNSGNSTNAMTLPPSSEISAITHTQNLAIVKNNTPAINFKEKSLTNGYSIRASISATNDFGLIIENDRNGELFVFTPDGDLLWNIPDRGLILRDADDEFSYRISLDDKGNIISQNTTGFDRKLNSDIPTDTAGAASYTLAYLDTGHTVWMTSAIANVVNIPLFATVALSEDTTVNVVQEGTGQTTIQAPVGVTLNGVDNGSFVLGSQHDSVKLINRGADTWIATGAVSTTAGYTSYYNYQTSVATVDLTGRTESKVCLQLGTVAATSVTISAPAFIGQEVEIISLLTANGTTTIDSTVAVLLADGTTNAINTITGSSRFVIRGVSLTQWALASV